MLKTITLLLLGTTIFALPALAQNTKPVAADQKQCTDQFKAADITTTACSTGLRSAMPSRPCQRLSPTRTA
jgi:hypothetical protein